MLTGRETALLDFGQWGSRCCCHRLASIWRLYQSLPRSRQASSWWSSAAAECQWRKGYLSTCSTAGTATDRVGDTICELDDMDIAGASSPFWLQSKHQIPGRTFRVVVVVGEVYSPGHCMTFDTFRRGHCDRIWRLGYQSAWDDRCEVRSVSTNSHIPHGSVVA